MTSCSIPGCDKKRERRDLCRTHDWRAKHYGDPQIEPPLGTRGRPARRLCSVEGCGQPHNAHGLCSHHEYRQKHPERLRQSSVRLCSIPGCVKKYSRRGFCQMHAWRAKHYGDPSISPPLGTPGHPHPTCRKCSVPGCNRPHSARGYCQTHVRRVKRGVPLDWSPPPLALKRYKVLRRREHPLADVTGRVYEHRLVLYDRVQGSRLPCHWCGAPLEWGSNLVVDHLDHNRHNNNFRNLVPACGGCNAGRTSTNPTVRVSVFQPVEAM